MKHQKGYIWRVGRSWYGRWYRDEFEKGVKVRRQHSERLAEYGDRFRSKKDVQPLLDEKLAPVNEGKCTAESTLTIAKYVEDHFLPYAESQLKPSTVHGYKGLWRMYLKPRLDDISLRDFTCGKATRLIADIYRDRDLSRKSLRHCKGLLQTIFAHAISTDVLFGENPIRGAKYPRDAVAANRNQAYTPDEIVLMLDLLSGTARTAVALMFFGGLRPGEARGLKWSDYDADKRVLNVRRSIWRKHETGPKTQESMAPVRVAKALKEILEGAPRSSEFILATPSGRPVDLHNLAARMIVPSLTRCSVCRTMESEHAKADHEFEKDASLPTWKGFYALRRGLGTLATSVERNPVAAKGLLRHSNVATTMAHYVKDLPEETISAMDKIDALFDNAYGRLN